MPPKKITINNLVNEKLENLLQAQKGGAKNTKQEKKAESSSDEETSNDETESDFSEDDVEDELEDELEESDTKSKTSSKSEIESETETETETEKESIAQKTEIKYDVEELEHDDDCMYKFTKKVNDDDVIEDDFAENDTINETQNYNSVKITKSVLTKYERVALLSIRTKQLALGAKPMLKNTKGMDVKEIAREELKLKVIPLILIRTLPTGDKEKWKITELTF